MKNLCKQILRFGFVGGTAFVLDFVTLWLLTETVGINYLVSNCMSFAISTVYNYVMSVTWVFKVNNQNSKSKNFFAIVVLSVVGLGFNQLIMLISVETLHINYLIAKVCATFIVMVYNFITRKVFLERTPR